MVAMEGVFEERATRTAPAAVIVGNPTDIFGKPV
jgi:hypothetical protein